MKLSMQHSIADVQDSHQVTLCLVNIVHRFQSVSRPNGSWSRLMVDCSVGWLVGGSVVGVLNLEVCVGVTLDLLVAACRSNKARMDCVI